jgi:hypothetical protein
VLLLEEKLTIKITEVNGIEIDLKELGACEKKEYNEQTNETRMWVTCYSGKKKAIIDQSV